MESNERLEFLGDAILGAIVSDEVYRRYPAEPEGALTRLRSSLVRSQQLADWGAEIELDRFLYLAPGERASESGRERILAGAFEALIGAIYLDRGLQATRSFINSRLKRDIERVVLGVATANPKGRLQELTQNHFRRAPVYRTLMTGGAATCPAIHRGGALRWAEARRRHGFEQTNCRRSRSSRRTRTDCRRRHRSVSGRQHGRRDRGRIAHVRRGAAPLADGGEGTWPDCSIS